MGRVSLDFFRISTLVKKVQVEKVYNACCLIYTLYPLARPKTHKLWMMLYLAHAQRLQGVISHPQIVNDALPCTRATASPNSVKSAMRGSSWRSISLMFIVACTLAWFRTDKGLYALIERAMAYCWLRYWDKKRYNQTAIPFIHAPQLTGACILLTL